MARIVKNGLGIWLLACLMASYVQAEPIGEGQVVPNWILSDSKGNSVSLYDRADEGQITVMVFWATWCRNSKELLSQISRLNDHTDGKPAVFYLLNVWEDSDPLAFIEKHNLNLPVLLRADNVAKRFDVAITPSIVVIGTDKRVIYKHTAHGNVDEVASQLEKLLGFNDSDPKPDR